MITPARVIGIDPGSDVSGICSIEDTTILYASNTPNTEVFDKIKELLRGSPEATIVIEDIFPYSVRLKPEVIATCKFIGELSYRLKEAGVAAKFVARNSIKKWVFDNFPDICINRIDEKIARLHAWRVKKGKRGYETKSGELRAASFAFVDDRIVIAALKFHLSIPTPKPGKANIYGLRDHSWQALAVAAYFRHILDKKPC